MVAKKRQIVLHYHDVVLDEEDMETLKEGQWLNDNIMTFYMEYTERELIPQGVNDILLLRPTMSQLVTYYPGTPSDLTSALPPHFDKRRFIFIPINNGTPETANNGTHWSLLVYSRPTNRFYHYDSLHSTNIKEAKLTAKRMTALLGTRKSPDFKSSSAPQQENGADCGLMVVGIMDCLIKQALASSSNSKALKLDASSKVQPPNETRSWLKSLVYHLQPLTKSLSPKRILAKLV
ncbi:hypothetical protein BCR42DRAFT_401774 [Absidia repens]|uniref:Ubiquitin-like protease family profile domain-containing protein n=1 Tax=Absidia repens TaxID=90262 RepID=A0A1X2J322_9FUNG|nr:hypothetical protein BCR42DRAFT_401774 [Absidia repens]